MGLNPGRVKPKTIKCFIVASMLEPMLNMNNDCMVPYKMFILLCQSEIQDGCHLGTNLALEPLGKIFQNYYLKPLNHL